MDAGESPKSARAIRILTANLRRGRADAATLGALIDRLQVDVVCVQELRPWLVAALPQGRLGANHRRREVGVACRYDAEVVELPLPGRSGWAARLSPASWPQLHTPIDIVSAHILAPHMRPYALNRSMRRGQLAGLLDFLAREPDVPKAILGDFNASPLWPVYRQLASRLTDAAVSAARRGEKPRPTWPQIPALGLKGLLRIDHCFVSRLCALQAQVVPITGSDHLGLCVDVAPRRAGSIG